MPCLCLAILPSHACSCNDGDHCALAVPRQPTLASWPACSCSVGDHRVMEVTSQPTFACMSVQCRRSPRHGREQLSHLGMHAHAGPAVRASSATRPARPAAPSFFIRTAKNGLVVPPVPRFCPDLGLHPSGEPRLSPAFRGALGDSGQKKCARNSEETSRASCGPKLSAREGGRRPHRLVFRASSSSPRIVFVRCKSCRR
jgi:hypothetical protein